MRNNVKVLVLMSTYNGEKYIRNQIDSILCQKGDIEIFLRIRDDGSRDKTIDIVNSYMSRNENITLIKGLNIGYVNSFFELLKTCDSDYDYIALSDQDDVWKQDKISCAIEMINKHENGKPVLYASTSYLVDDNLKKNGETQKLKKELNLYNTLIQNIMPGHTLVMNIELVMIINNHQFDYSKIYVHDSWICNIAILFGSVVFDNTSHTLYRQHSGNQLGYRAKGVGWISQRLKRIITGDAYKYSVQIKYFYDCFSENLPHDIKREINLFYNSQGNLLNRIIYAIKTKFYRQKFIETVLFKILYIFAGYNINHFIQDGGE